MRGFPSPGDQLGAGMSARLRIAPVFATAILAIGLLLTAAAGQGQKIDYSQQIQLFNSMTPEQQQAILQRLGGGTGVGSTGIGSLGGTGLGGLGTGSSLLGGGTTNRSQSVLLQQMQLQQQRRLAGKLQDQTELPVFKIGDTVLVEVSLLAEKPAASGNQSNQNIPNAPSGQNNPTGNPNATSINPALLNNSQRSLLGLDSGMNGQRVQEQPQRTIEELQAEERQKLEDMIEQIRARNPYVLDPNGQLQLPGIPGMALAGLTEDLATRRVAAEPAFEKLLIKLTRLPLDKSGKDALKPFGYELFDNSLLSLLPTLDTPVPGDYVMGPGDILQIQLFGSQNQMLT